MKILCQDFKKLVPFLLMPIIKVSQLDKVKLDIYQAWEKMEHQLGIWNP